QRLHARSALVPSAALFRSRPIALPLRWGERSGSPPFARGAGPPLQRRPIALPLRWGERSGSSRSPLRRRGSAFLLPFQLQEHFLDRKSTRLNSSHVSISYA